MTSSPRVRPVAASAAVAVAVAVAAVVVAVVAGSACDLLFPPPPADVGEPLCPGTATQLGCDSDRVCADGFCEKASAGDLCGLCVTVLCSGNDDCRGGDVCDTFRSRCERPDACALLDPWAGAGCGDDGALLCAPIDEAQQCTLPLASSCEIAPAVVVGVAGASAPAVAVLALDDMGRPLPAPADVTLPPALVDAGGVALCAGPERCVDVVSAAVPGALDDVTCSAPFVVLPPSPPGAVRVVARDFVSGAAVVGAAVRVDVDVGGLREHHDAVTDEHGVSTLELALADEGDDVAGVRIDAAGYETTALFAPGTRDIELALLRAPEPGRIAGRWFRTRFDALPAVGDIKLALSTLSAPDLASGLDAEALVGVTITTVIEIAGVTDPGGNDAPQDSATTMDLGTSPLLGTGAAFGRPGKHLLSSLGGALPLAEIGPIVSGTVAGDDDLGAPYDGLLAIWKLASDQPSFDVGGTVESVEGARPLRSEDLEVFVPSESESDGESPSDAYAGVAAETQPRVTGTGDVDVVVPRLLPGHDAAFVALYAHVPGRGLVLLAVQFFDEVDGNGLVVQRRKRDDVANEPRGTVRMSVAPSLYIVDRALVVVAGSGTVDGFRFGPLTTDRVATVLAAPSDGSPVPTAQLPSFRTERAVVDGTLVTVPPRTDGELVFVEGARYRAWLGPALTQADLAALSLDAPVRVWAAHPADSADGAFVAGGPGVVERTLTRPRAVFAMYVAP